MRFLKAMIFVGAQLIVVGVVGAALEKGGHVFTFDSLAAVGLGEIIVGLGVCSMFFAEDR